MRPFARERIHKRKIMVFGEFVLREQVGCVSQCVCVCELCLWRNEDNALKLFGV